MDISPLNFLQDLKTSRPIKIKVFNLGENLGMDFAYFGHYHALKDLFPNVLIDLYRSNVDETNCIGLENFEGKAILPLDDFRMEIVKQRYGDYFGPDWTQKLNNKEYDIFTPSFRSIDGYDYVWGIGYGFAPCWQEQYPTDTKFINSPVVLAALEDHCKEQDLFPKLEVQDLGVNHFRLKPWERTLAEYLVLDKEDYPFAWNKEYKESFGNIAQDYLRVGLRWPDHVRWYWSIDRQYEALFEIIRKIRATGKPVKLVYTLKDGEIGNNFNRGQSLQHLKKVQDLCDDCIFTYSWTEGPYWARKTEQQELQILQQAGIKKVLKVDIWEDLIISSQAKVYFSDPGGFAEVICMLRPANTTFLMPTSFGHLCTYITLDQNRQPVNVKINQVCVDQGYKCKGILSAPDDPEGYRTKYWELQYLDDKRQIGENNHGDDWKHFEKAQGTVFKDWFNSTKLALVDAIVEQYLKED